MNGTYSARGLSRHAQVRMQQRCVLSAAVDLLLDLGAAQHNHRGAVIVYFDKRLRRQLARAAGRDAMRALEPWRNTYAVVGTDGAVVTIGRRDERVRRR